MELILNWLLRGVFVLVGLGAGLWILRSLVRSRRAEEKWPMRLALGMLALVAIYALGHARLLVSADELEASRMAYARYGDPRLAEQRRAEVRGWILDCTGEPDEALADYRAEEGVVRRRYPLGQAGANFIGGGSDSVPRDYTVERLFTDELRRPRSLLEAGELHPAGTDLALTLCRAPTSAAWRLLRQSGLPGAVVVQDVATGALVAYAATGGPTEAPLGVKRYFAPGSVFKLALAALWWEHDLPDDEPLPCPARIQVSPRASIGNYGGEELGTVIGPVGMLVPSCNTAAIVMAQRMRERLGVDAFLDAYRRFGFRPYAGAAPRDTAVSDFWATSSDAWARRMSPPPGRLRMSARTNAHEWALEAIGQGPVDVTVIGVSRFVQAIGNGGVMLRPTIERSQVERRGAREGERIMSERTAEKLRRAMLEVVSNPMGTAHAAGRVLRDTGWRMGGKTGTAEVAGQRDNGWFAGLAFDPEGRPRYTVVVFLERGGPGGRMPAGIAAQMVRVLAEERPAPLPLRDIGEGVE